MTGLYGGGPVIRKNRNGGIAQKAWLKRRKKYTAKLKFLDDPKVISYILFLI